MSIPPKTFVTPEEYLELERRAEQKSLEAVGLDALIELTSIGYALELRE